MYGSGKVDTTGVGVRASGSVSKGTVNDYESSKLLKWSNNGKYDNVRGYRGRDLTEYNSEYLVDPRLVVEMNFKGVVSHNGVCLVCTVC
jgi:GTPase